MDFIELRKDIWTATKVVSLYVLGQASNLTSIALCHCGNTLGSWSKSLMKKYDEVREDKKSGSVATERPDESWTIYESQEVTQENIVDSHSCDEVPTTMSELVKVRIRASGQSEESKPVVVSDSK